jgi:hypothetical protein
MTKASTTFMMETPILLEALARVAHCTPEDAAEHLGGLDGDTLVQGYTVAEFIEHYAPAGGTA